MPPLVLIGFGCRALCVCLARVWGRPAQLALLAQERKKSHQANNTPYPHHHQHTQHTFPAPYTERVRSGRARQARGRVPSPLSPSYLRRGCSAWLLHRPSSAESSSTDRARAPSNTRGAGAVACASACQSSRVCVCGQEVRGRGVEGGRVGGWKGGREVI